MRGILTISPSYNYNFSRLLSYHGITAGDIWDVPGNAGWGINNKNYSYYACEGYPDQINLYRLHRASIGGLKSNTITYGDISDGTGKLIVPYLYNQPEFAVPEYIEDNLGECMRLATEHFSSNHCYILYSGGVDSTAIVTSFIKHCPKSDFTIAYTSASVVEYPLFFEYLSRNQYNLLNIEGVKLSSLQGTILHGTGGDALLPTVTSFSENQIYDHPWQEIINKEEWGQDYIQLFAFAEQYLSGFGKTVTTVAEACSMLALFTNHNCTFSNIHHDVDLSPTRMPTFFRFDSLYRWGYYHGHKYLKDNHLPTSYRIPMKELILSVTHDREYFECKTKVNSRHLWKLNCNTGDGRGGDSSIQYFFIDSTGERVSADSREDYREKYGNRFNSYFNTINTE